MENENEERFNKTLNEFFDNDKELFDAVTKVYNITSDLVDLVYDKYPGTTSAELATVGMHLFWDSCQCQNMSKSEIKALVINILKAM